MTDSNTQPAGMPTHTPGPWFSPERRHGARYVWARIGGGLLQEVAACGPTQEPTQQAANARLIAASPSMLEALRRADEFISNGIALGYIRMPDADTPDSAHQTPGIVRAAIALATKDQL